MQVTAAHTPRAPSRVLNVALSVVAISLLTGLAIVRYLPWTNADSLLSALISTQRLTVYYWGQDRLASVVPLLAWPVRDELWNYRLQILLLGGAFFSLVWMFVQFHLRATSRRVPVGLAAVSTGLAGLAIMAPFGGYTGFVLIFEQVYALSLTLYLLGARLLVTTSSTRAEQNCRRHRSHMRASHHCDGVHGHQCSLRMR